MLERIERFSNYVWESAPEISKWVGQMMGFGSAVVNGYIAFAPTVMQETKTCENARAQILNPTDSEIIESTFIKDAGLFLFYTACVSRGVAIPIMYKAFDQVSECFTDKPLLEESTQENLSSLEKSIIQSFSIGMVVNRLPIPEFSKIFLLLLSTAPITRFGVEKYIPDYPTIPSWPALQAFAPDNPRVAEAITFLESLLIGTKFALAANAVNYFFIDMLYDASHSSDYPHTNALTLGILGGGMALGMLSILKEKSYEYVNNFSATIQTCYPITMTLISTLMCLDPELEDVNKFNDKAIYIVFSILAGSLGLSIVNTKINLPKKIPDLAMQSALDESSVSVNIESSDLISSSEHSFFGSFKKSGSSKESSSEHTFVENSYP